MDRKIAGLMQGSAKRKDPASLNSWEVAMVTISRSTTVHARIDDVFSFLEDKAPLPAFLPKMIEVSEIRDLPNRGTHHHWTRKMAGLRYEGHRGQFEAVPNKKLVSKNEAGTGSTITWLMEGHGDDTDVTFKADYKVSVPVPGRLAEKAVVELNEYETETMLANLKTLIEA